MASEDNLSQLCSFANQRRLKIRLTLIHDDDNDDDDDDNFILVSDINSG